MDNSTAEARHRINPLMSGEIDLNAIRDLLVEANGIEAKFGKNSYSDYLRSHRMRPPAAEASAIGALLGGRVRADDGKMYPPISRKLRRERKRVQEDFKRKLGYDYVLEMHEIAEALRSEGLRGIDLHFASVKTYEDRHRNDPRFRDKRVAVLAVVQPSAEDRYRQALTLIAEGHNDPQRIAREALTGAEGPGEPPIS